MNLRIPRQVMLALLVSTMFAAASSCSDGDNNGGIVGGEPPDMLTDVTSLVFVEVPLGDTDVQTLTIMNVGKGDLKITSIGLFEETLNDSGAEFKTGDDWVNAVALGTNEQVRISVAYTPGDKQLDTGYVELQTNDPKLDDGILRVPLETPTLAPRIFSKESVIFRRVPPVTESTRNKFWQLTEVQNIGSAPLDINDLIVTPQDAEFSVSFPATMDLDADPADDADTLAGTLEPGTSFPIRVYFNPTDDLPSSAELIFYSNDPRSSEYAVNLLGNSGSPCLQLTEEEQINFGEGAIGYANNKTMVLENCSPTSDLTVTEIDVCTMVEGSCDAASPIFAIKEGSLPSELPDNPAVLGPQDTATFVLTYTPTDLSVSDGELHITSDDPAKSQLVVPITGKGTDNQCPQAVAEATVTGGNRWQAEVNTIPLKTIAFRGTNSVDPDGQVTRYEWNIVQRPAGSTAQMTPTNEAPNPSLFLDLAGEYIVELKAYDDHGTQSCGDQAIVTITAIPDERVHVQLVWDTPADADQTDIYGSDVDLHFLHPFGQWDEGPYDIYWLNSSADWGTPGDPSDDPSLDIDDVDGAGPENINVDRLEDGLTYRVGVYYYGDGGFGPSYATVRVYIDGMRSYEKEMLLSGSGRFWDVGSLNWPNTAFIPTNTTRDGFP